MEDEPDLLDEFQIQKLRSQEDKDELIFGELADRVADLMQHKMETLLSMLYRLDVDETKIRQALDSGSDLAPHIAIAKLIVERQIARAKTKENYRTDPIEGWEDF